MEKTKFKYVVIFSDVENIYVIRRRPIDYSGNETVYETPLEAQKVRDEKNNFYNLKNNK